MTWAFDNSGLNATPVTMESWVDNNNNQFGTTATPGADIVADTGNTSIPRATTVSGMETFNATASAYSQTMQVTAVTTAGATIDLDNNAAISASPINMPSITTSQTPVNASVGESISDTATVTSLVSPSSGDTVTFNLYSSHGQGTPAVRSPTPRRSASTAARPRPRRKVTPPRPAAPTTGWPPSTATAPTPRSPAALPRSR